MSMETTTTTTSKSTTSTTTMKPVDPSRPNFCVDGRMDTIFMTEDKTVYSFNGDHYALVNDNGIGNGYPRPINWDWSGLPDDMDAAISIDARYGWVYSYSTRRWNNTKLIDERIYFFKQHQVFRFNRNRKMMPGYPKDINKEFLGLPNEIDSAFVWSGNGRLYFTKGMTINLH